ncbi:helix-turn-helix domain-containing protein [Arcticibacter sp. MXS-1]|uniref:helix-turn-helix domain-containing protein n=1 Tax=Arcticibacter sp. MXS-1 TaxID=3341726 RepID=UPI0035A89F00
MTQCLMQQQFSLLEEGQRQLKLQLEKILEAIQNLYKPQEPARSRQEERLRALLGKPWLDSQEVMLLLGISRRQLQRLRYSGVLRYSSQSGGKCWYHSREVEQYMESQSRQSRDPLLKDNPYLK